MTGVIPPKTEAHIKEGKGKACRNLSILQSSASQVNNIINITVFSSHPE